MASHDDSSLEIDRVPLTLLATTTLDRSELLLQRIRAAIEGNLSKELALCCGPALAQDNGYLFIDKLEVECSVSGEWSDEAIGRCLGKHVSQSVLRRVDRQEGIWFTDRAEYVAAFMVAAVDGQAFSRWWFEGFDGLRPLPVSAALRTLILNEGETGIAALTRLTREATEGVLKTLSEPDAQRVLTALLARRSVPTGSVGAATLWQIAAKQCADLLKTEPRQQLAAALALERHYPGATSNHLRALQVLALLHTAARIGRFRNLLAQEFAPQVMIIQCCQVLGLDADVVASWSEPDCAMLVNQLRQLTPANVHDDAEQDSATTTDFTPHGGALLLLAQVLRLDWWSSWRDALLASEMDRDAAEELASSLTLAVVSRALSPQEPALIQDDSLLRLVFGIDAVGPLDRIWKNHKKAALHILRRTTSNLTAKIDQGSPAPCNPLEQALQQCASHVLDSFAARIPGCTGSSHDYLRKQCLTLSASLTISAQSIEARLGRPPLDVLLVLAGIKRATLTLPDGRQLILSEERQW